MKQTLTTILTLILGIYHISAMIFDFGIPKPIHMSLLAGFLICILYLQCEELHISNYKEDDYKWKPY